jgi:collagen type I alpha
MFSKLHDRLGTAGLVVAIVALVAALTGTAFAAAGLNSKQKKEVTKIAQKYAGKDGKDGKDGTPGAPGAAGAVGPIGPVGTAGTAGAKGATGPTGATGVTGPTGPTGLKGVEGLAGEDGPTGPTGQTGPSCPEGYCFLPSKATETGSWVVQFNNEGFTALPLNLPLKAPIDAAHSVVVPEGGTAPAECNDGAGEGPSTGNPEADPGYFCVFVTGFEGTNAAVGSILNPSGAGSGPAKTGALLLAIAEGAAVGSGTFAVTAP